MVLVPFKIVLFLLTVLLVGESFTPLALADTGKIDEVCVEQDDAGERWKIILPEQALSTKNLHVELDVRAPGMEEMMSYYAWKDEQNPKIYFVKYDQINLSKYTVRASVNGNISLLNNGVTESNWIVFDGSPAQMVEESDVLPSQENRDSLRGLILFGAVLCWLLLLNSWVSVKLQEFKKSAEKPDKATGNFQLGLKSEVQRLKAYAMPSRRKLTSHEDVLFDPKLDEILEDL